MSSSNQKTTIYLDKRNNECFAFVQQFHSLKDGMFHLTWLRLVVMEHSIISTHENILVIALTFVICIHLDNIPGNLTIWTYDLFPKVVMRPSIFSLMKTFALRPWDGSYYHHIVFWVLIYILYKIWVYKGAVHTLAHTNR